MSPLRHHLDTYSCLPNCGSNLLFILEEFSWQEALIRHPGGEEDFSIQDATLINRPDQQLGKQEYFIDYFLLRKDQDFEYKCKP